VTFKGRDVKSPVLAPVGSAAIEAALKAEEGLARGKIGMLSPEKSVRLEPTMGPTTPRRERR